MKGSDKKLLAITSCPNGIAHTYMAAENLQKAADKLGIGMKVETQGSIGVENEFTDEEIRQADGIIIAADKNVDKSRFVGKKLLVVGVQEGIRTPEALIQKVLTGEVPVYEGKGDENTAAKKAGGQNQFYRHLMSGVSYMIPFIVVGGLLIAIALSIGGVPTPAGLQIPEDSFWKTIERLGAASFTFMVPILAGFISYSIADRPGLAPGLIGGYIAANGSFYGSEAGAGFLGGIIAGFLAGYIALWIKKWKVPKAISAIMPIIIIPVLASLAVGLIFIYLLGGPISAIFTSLTTWLAGMQGASSIVLALILGAMIAFDMGGPVNKVAYMFGSAMIAEGNYQIMGPVAVAIAIPPIGLGLATFMFRRKFHDTERESGKAAFTMGLFGITEGAIPFASQDPLRVIPSIMIGSMAGSVIAMLGGVGDRVAHGGAIVAILGAVDNVFMFFIALIVGSLVTAFMIKLLKKDVAPPQLAAAGAGAAGVVNTAPPAVERTSATANKATAVASENKPVTKLTDIINAGLIEPSLKATTRDGIIGEMIALLDAQDVITSRDAVKQAILNREQESSTGIGMNIAVPHAKSDAVTKPRVVFGIKHDGIDWSSVDGTPAKLIFMIVVPAENKGNEHLKILQMLSRKLMDDGFRERLLQITSKEEAFKLLEEVR